MDELINELRNETFYKLQEEEGALKGAIACKKIIVGEAVRSETNCTKPGTSASLAILKKYSVCPLEDYLTRDVTGVCGNFHHTLHPVA